MKIFSTLLLGIILSSTVFLTVGTERKKSEPITNPGEMAASVFLSQSTSSDKLRDSFNTASSTNKKINILIVPGHEPNFGGAGYRDIWERDLNAELSLYLAQYLVEDGHYETVLARGREAWNPHLEKYFSESSEEIRTFVEKQKREMAQLVSEGKMTAVGNGVPHNDAPHDVALRLFGINRWANEHNVDIILHVHFNDSVPRKKGRPGEYNGFTIYTPEKQYSNAEASLEIAKYVFGRLSKMFPVSNLEGEDEGVVEDQNLIAVGSSNTVDAASLLIEYGYIYEPQFNTPSVRTMVLKELALQTYVGLSDFFGKEPTVAGVHGSTLLPYVEESPIKKTATASAKVLALQAALLEKGFYPPQNYTKNDCPISGLFGKCTKEALDAFQYEFQIKGEVGVAGPKTRTQLRKLFEPRL